MYHAHRLGRGGATPSFRLLGVWIDRPIGPRRSTRSSWRASGSQSDAAGLQVAGPYRLVRHPLYLGWILVVFGAAHMTGDRLAFAAITTLYLVVAIPWEERSLRARVRRATTSATCGTVRWRIIPFIY